MSLNVTHNGPPIAHPSVCLKKLLFIVNVTSVAKFNNKRLKMNFEQIAFNFFLLYILVSISFYCIYCESLKHCLLLL